MYQTNVYDLPTRIIHWSLALLFLLSFSIGKFVDDESFLYPYHMLSGLLMSFLVILRVIWGFIGTKHARFKSFRLSLKELKEYFAALKSGREKKYIGHNPASSFAGVLILALSFFMTITGLFMVQRIGKELFEEVHEIGALVFAVIVVTHIAGVLFHEFRHRDKMIFSMFSGKKFLSDTTHVNIKNSYSVSVILIVLMVFFINYLGQNYNTNNGTLKLFGNNLNLLEEENEHDTEYYNNYYKLDKEDDDD